MNVPEPLYPQPESTAVEALALHRDPSLPGTHSKMAPHRETPGIAWVRPSEMPTLLGSGFVARGLDLEAELTRRARRAPGVAASRASSRVTRSSIADTTPDTGPTSTREGLGL